MSNSNTAAWQLFNYQQPSDLKEAIQYLHRAAQYVAIAGNSLLPKEDDDSQSNMEWVPSLKMMVGRELALDQAVRVGLQYEKFELYILNDTFQVLFMLPLTGQTEDQVYGWLQSSLAKLGASKENINPISHFELPPHELDEKGIFQVAKPILHTELITYRTNTNLILEEITEKYPESSSIRVWPHHFDTGAIITVEKDDSGTATKTIGIGLAIPDEQIQEPYFYVNHWSEETIEYDELTALPGGGGWLTQNTPMATLKASQIVKRTTEEQQYRQVQSFFEEAINFSMKLLQQTEAQTA